MTRQGSTRSGGTVCHLEGGTVFHHTLTENGTMAAAVGAERKMHPQALTEGSMQANTLCVPRSLCAGGHGEGQAFSKSNKRPTEVEKSPLRNHFL